MAFQRQSIHMASFGILSALAVLLVAGCAYGKSTVLLGLARYFMEFESTIIIYSSRPNAK